MSGILGGIVNLAGALSQGNDLQNQERVKSALQQASITRQGQQDQLAAAIRERQFKRQEEQDRIAEAVRKRQGDHQSFQDSIAAFGKGLVPVQPGDPGQTSDISQVPMPAGPRYDFGSQTVEYHKDLDPQVRRQANTLEQIDERGNQSRQTRAVVPGGSHGGRGGQATLAAKRSQYILRRIPQLTKSSKGISGLPPQPGMSTDDAIQHAGEEFDRTQGVSSPQATPAVPVTPRASTNPNDTPGPIDLGGPSPLSSDQLAAHQKIDAAAKAAILAGKDPQAVAERANQLHAQLQNSGNR